MKSFHFFSLSLLLSALAATPFATAQQPVGRPVTSRPQEPQPPFPYQNLEVTYDNPSAPGVRLAATLSIPASKSKAPAVVFIGGSGQTPRDQPFFGHRMVAVLADHLTRQGIAVLRFDDRGAGGSSAGSTPMHMLTEKDFVSDARAGVDYLKTRAEIDSQKIGVIGHSEGTKIAQLLAASSPDDIAFVVLLAAAGAEATKGEIVAHQSEVMAKAWGFSEESQQIDREFILRALPLIRSEDDADQRREKITAVADELIPQLPEDEREKMEPLIRQRVDILSSENFYQDAVAPRRDYLAELRCPVLALNGGKDVLVSAEKNGPRIEASLEKGGNPASKAVVFPELNHMFQTANTGLMEEAEVIDETFSPAALKLIGEWISEQTD